jgi:hypothetical protein
MIKIYTLLYVEVRSNAQFHQDIQGNYLFVWESQEMEIKLFINFNRIISIAGCSTEEWTVATNLRHHKCYTCRGKCLFH